MRRFAASILLFSLLVLTIPASQALDRMDERLAACAACHGEQGRSRQEAYYPSIAGKPARYLFNQLRHFRDGRRPHELMAGLLASLSDDYLRHIANYYAAQPPRVSQGESAPDPQSAAEARRLITDGDLQRGIPACVDCHGQALHGRLPAIPGLTGLPADYIAAQMGAWREGVRSAGPRDCMARIATRMSVRQIEIVAAWLAAQPTTKADQPAPAGPRPLPFECDFSEDRPEPKTEAPSEKLRRGAYLVRAGNCLGCHSARGGAAWAGGRGIPTPFGTVYSSNLTPDDDTGIGRWSADDFWAAIHEGVSADGRLLYPAFPYTHFTRVTRADSDAMLAYLKSLAPVSRPAIAHELRFPFNTQLALRFWRWLYFEPGGFDPDAERDPRWHRGRYLVEALGHCSACHGERNALGALRPARAFAGSLLPDRDWYAPALQASTDPLRQTDLLTLLRDGSSAQGVMTGPMAEVVANSLQHLATEDLQAMIHYIASQSPTAPSEINTLAVSPGLQEQQMQIGAGIYDQHCASCHGPDGRGEAQVFPPLAANPSVVSAAPGNAIRLVKFGGFAPSTQGHPYPFGMPPYAQQLSHQDIAAVLTYIRNAWGNRASAVSPVAVRRQ